ncbi:MAG: DUF393 domain-containing protein [Bacteroidia bacterium]|nr:DUF393 domain-containing protein [Bacteroidia bacterium]
MGRLYYDGLCPFCSKLVRWGQQFLASERIQWVPLDYSDRSQLPVPVESVIYEDEGGYWVKTEAIRRLLLDSGHPFLAKLLGIIPLRWRDWMYDRIAERRYCWGKKCSQGSDAPCQ